MGWIKKLRDAREQIEQIVEEEAPRPAAPKPAPKPKPDDAKFVRRLGERIGFAGIAAATVLAAGVGLVGCKPVAGTPSPATSSCEEDQPCWDCHTMGNHQCGPEQAPATKASCEEPAAWCHRGDAAEVRR